MHLARRLSARWRELHDLGLNRRAALLMLGLNFLGIAFEGFGLAMLLPILEFLRAGGNAADMAEKGAHWEWLAAAAGKVNLELSLGLLLLTAFLLIFARQLTSYARSVLRAVVRQRAAHQLRMRGLKAFFAAHTQWQKNVRAGELVNDFVLELPLAVNALYDSILLIGSFATIALYIGLLAFLSPELTAATLAIFVLVGLLLRPALRGTRASSGAVSDANKNIGAFLTERIRAARLVRLAATEKLELSELERISQQRAQSTIRMQVLSAMTASTIEPLTVGMGFLVIFAGFTWASMSLEAIAVFLLILIRLLPAAKEAFGDYQTNQAQWVNFQIVHRRLAEMEATAERRGHGITFPGLQNSISFEDVSLRFPESPVYALRNVNLEVPAGSIVALMGPSGAGKSTLIDCIPRLIDPDEGCIAIDTTPLKEIQIESLRRNVAYVPQEPQLFDITAAEHIAYGSPGIPRDEIIEAAQIAGAHDFIMQLAEGYDTKLGEAARRFSGGQRQRLDLARAIAHRAPILILDEPASALDAESEAHLISALVRLRDAGTRTIIVVAHSFAFPLIADYVAVMEGGRITEIGKHAQLVAAGGWYAQAYGKAHTLRHIA